MEILERLSEIVGEKFVLTGKDAEPFGSDWMGTYVGHPLAVICPANTSEVSAVLRLLNRESIPVVPIGGNTGLVGGTYTSDGLMLSLHRMNCIRKIKPDAQIAVVESGVILDNLHQAASEQNLSFPLFFGARGSAMIGGVLSTNAGGSNVVRYGNTRAMCLGLEVVLADGRILNLMSELHKDNTGYDLKNLFIGAEGTLGVITAATLKIVPEPQEYATAMVAARNLKTALTMLNRLQVLSGGLVEGFEFMPRTYMQRLLEKRPDLVPPLGYDQETTILVELGATALRDTQPNEDGSVPLTELLETALMGMIDDKLADDAVVARSNSDRMKMWAIREAAAEITHGQLPYVDTDISVPLDRVSDFYETVQIRLKEIDPTAETNTVAHLGDGNLHFTVWPSRNEPALHRQIRDMIDNLAMELKGSFSAEHGIGLTKKATLSKSKDPVAYEVMKIIKKSLDPNGIMNPGKVLT